MPQSDAHQTLANARKALEAQEKINKGLTSQATAAAKKLNEHTGDIKSLRTDVNDMSEIVSEVATNQTLHAGKLTALSDNHDGTVQRVTALEKGTGKQIDWLGALTFTAVAAVLSGIFFYCIVFWANWDPFLMVQDGVVADVKDKVYSILMYHVIVYTLVISAVVFAICVCTMTKPAAQPKQSKTDDKAKADKPKAQKVDKTDEMPAAKKPTPSQTTGLKPPPGGRTLEQVYQDTK